MLVHPAWHSCGSHQVFVSQAQAYRALGATVLSLAVADFPGWVDGSKAHHAYLAATGDLIADRRHFAGMPSARIATPSFLEAAWKWLHGNAAQMLCETMRRADLPGDLTGLARIDLIHCNHFFCMPAALALRAGRPCRIVLESHDVQARQFVLRNEKAWRLPPKATFEDMLALEIAQMAEADLLIHLNDEEAKTWQSYLPQKRHALLYPAIKSVAANRGGRDLIIVASDNYPNFLSVAWFLEEVRPRVADAAIKIIGNIDQAFKARAPELFRQHADLFLGRVDDLDAVYANAAAILLPTTSGHGISIKTIEALSSGAFLIATPEAFRGMAIDPSRLANVTLVPDAPAFAAAVERAAKMDPNFDATASDTRRLYERTFSPDAYQRSLADCVAPYVLINGAPGST